MAWPTLAGAFLAAFAGTPLHAQAGTPFTHWTLPPELTHARTAGLADAVVALDDDAALVRRNPAALAFAPRTFDGSAAGRSGAPFSYLSAAFHPKRSLGLGATAFSRPIAELAARGKPVADGGSGTGWDEHTRLSEVGLAGAWRLTSRLSAGAALHAAELRVEATRPDAPPIEGRAWRPRAVIGLAFESPSRDAPRVSLAVRLPATWRVRPEGAPELVFRGPTTISTGASWDYHFGGQRPSRVLVAMQSDVLRHTAPATGARPDGFDARFHLDLRFGLELSVPLSRCFSGCGSLLQLRGGVARLALAPSAARPGPTPEHATTWHAGLALAPGGRMFNYGRFKIDAAVRFAPRGTTFLFGVSARVPEGYRALVRNE